MTTLLILFEGLGLCLFPLFSSNYVKRAMAPINIKIEQHGWMSKGSVPCPAIPAVIVSHSFGISAAREMAERCRLPWVSIDGRRPPAGSGGVVAPIGLPVSNFYQTGFMRGYPIAGARNIELKNVSHTAIPFRSEVLTEVRKMLLLLRY